MPESNLYEREQLAAKLQNLKTQFRNRKIAIDEGIVFYGDIFIEIL